jgi:glycine C-acetyltransferase
MNPFSHRLISQRNMSLQGGQPHAPVRFVGPNKVIVAGRDALSFIGSDYLQLAFNPLIRRSLVKGFQSADFHLTGPRSQWGTTEMHLKTEARLASFLGTEAALLMSSRSQACYSLLSVLLTESDSLLFSDRSESPLRDICELISCRYHLLNPQSLLEPVGRLSPESLSLCVLDSTNTGIGGSTLGLSGSALQQAFSMVVIDETYALSGAGLRGAGIHEAFDFFGDGFCLYGELAPLIPSSVGFIAGPRAIIEEVRQRSRVLLFENGPSPAFLPALLEGIDCVELMSAPRGLLLQKRDFVADQIDVLVSEGSLERPPLPILQLVFSSFKQLESFCTAMLGRGVLIEQVAFTGVQKRHYLARICFNVNHREEDIARLIESLMVVATR